MAQLPPKIPSIMTNSAGGRTMPAAAGSDWAEEFMEFSPERRGSHRRSASDSVAFLDDNDHHLLMSIFCHDISPPSSSDHNTNNDDSAAAVKPEPGEADSPPPPPEEGGSLSPPPPPPGYHPISDPKRVKRILANRQSAQRSRVRKLQYISELERSVTTLQSEVSALSPRVAFLDHQRLILNVDNSAIKQRIAALAQDKIFKDAHQEALKKEIERLRQVYEHQNTRCGNQNARPQLSSTQPNSDDMEF